MENDEVVSNSKLLNEKSEAEQPSWWEPISERSVTFESMEYSLASDLSTVISLSDDPDSEESSSESGSIQGSSECSTTVDPDLESQSQDFTLSSLASNSEWSDSDSESESNAGTTDSSDVTTESSVASTEFSRVGTSSSAENITVLELPNPSINPKNVIRNEKIE